MTSILDSIGVSKKAEVTQAKKALPLAALLDLPKPSRRNFTQALQTKKPAVIAEIKRASPSKGVLRADFDVAEISKIYTEVGASCLSVLTDIEFFQGDPKNIAIAKAHSPLPVLRKDFIIDPYQIYQSRVLGADCILLIVAMLDDAQLLDYCQLAQALEMDVLVESHTLEELERALKLPTSLMGINNRSLHTFSTDIEQSIKLRQYIPADKIMISESGIQTQQDIQHLQHHGIHTFLIGEQFMKADCIRGAFLQLLQPN